MFKRLLVKMWNIFFDFLQGLEKRYFLLHDKVYAKIKRPVSMISMEETIEHIIVSHCSISRFGDGEIKLASGRDLAFQPCSPLLKRRMREVLSSNLPNHEVCVPEIFGDLSMFTEEAFSHWKLHLGQYRPQWYHLLNRNRRYYNAFISRCYMMWTDKSRAPKCFELMKRTWAGRDVLLIEGEKSRLGIGNDLFDDVSSIKRILAPNKDAFRLYDSIFSKATELAGRDTLILLALGPTATILAYDLAGAGFQAVDIGHVDIEYEWWKMGATHKVPVKNKFVNEAGAGSGVGDEHDEKYLSEIACRF